MKKFRPFLTLIVSLFMATAFTACGDDDDEPSTPAAKEIAGTYLGDIDCTVMSATETFEDKTVVITATSDSEVSITLDSFGTAPMLLPSIKVDHLKVTGNDGIYSVASSNFEGTTSDGKKYSGTIQAKYTNGVIVIDFKLQYGMMPMPMICKFTSSK